MCVVSMVVGPWTNPVDPNYVPWTPEKPDPATASQMLDVIRRLEALDRKFDNLECKVEAEAKRKFKQKLKRRAKKR